MRAALFLTAIVLVPAAAAATPEPPKAEKPAEEKMICKGERSLEFGSHRRAKKVCKTEAEWKLLEDGTQRELRSFQERAQTHGNALGRQ